MSTTIETLPNTVNADSVLVTGPAQDHIRELLAGDETIAEYRDQAEPSLASEMAAIKVGIYAVRKAIRFVEHAPTPWERPTETVGNCINFAWATSGVVADLGMTSRLAHCNGHVMNVVVGKSRALHVLNSDDLPHAWYFDAANPSKSPLFDAEAAIAIPTVTDTEPYVTTLDTESLERQVHYERRVSGNTKVTPKLWMAARSAGITIMTPYYAAHALQNRSDLIRGLQQSDVVTTTTALAQLQTHNYDHESRPDINGVFEKFLRTSRYWCRDNTISEEIVGAAFESYNQLLDDSHAKHVRLGDAWRYLAEQRKSPDALARAEDYYRLAARCPRPHGPKLIGKLQATALLKSKLSTSTPDVPLTKVTI